MMKQINKGLLATLFVVGSMSAFQYEDVLANLAGDMDLADEKEQVVIAEMAAIAWRKMDAKEQAAPGAKEAYAKLFPKGVPARFTPEIDTALAALDNAGDKRAMDVKAGVAADAIAKAYVRTLTEPVKTKVQTQLGK